MNALECASDLVAGNGCMRRVIIGVILLEDFIRKVRKTALRSYPNTEISRRPALLESNEFFGAVLYKWQSDSSERKLFL